MRYVVCNSPFHLSMKSHPFPFRPLLVIATLTIGLVGGGGLTAWELYQDSNRLVHSELKLRTLTERLRYLNEALGTSARMSLLDTSSSWSRTYDAQASELTQLLDETSAVAPDPVDPTIQAVRVAAEALRKEREAALAEAMYGQPDQALAMLRSRTYWELQAAYSGALDDADNLLMGRSEGLLDSDGLRVEIAAFAAAFGLLALSLLWLGMIRRIRSYLDAVENADAALQSANGGLEQRVATRTAELVDVNERLRQEMEERSRMEQELRVAQRLEAMGRLAAGIAHEINTPMQYVTDSVHFLDGAVKDLVRVIELRGSGEGRQAQAANSEAVDLPYLLKHIPDAIHDSLEGLDRVTSIVRSMKDLAHAEQVEKAPVDINRVAMAALTIASSEYRYVARVETTYQEGVPPVLCHGGSIGQVLLNIIVNAAQAIGEVSSKTKALGLLALSTRQDGGDVVISIRDSGGGIPESAQALVFDPFFTTKEVGKGTGQGLAIARTVVEAKHGGKVSFETTAGQGTTFHIRLPIDGGLLAAPKQAA